VIYCEALGLIPRRLRRPVIPDLIRDPVKMFKEAIENYNQSIALFGDHYITYYNLGLCFYALESFEPALKSLKQSLKIEHDLQTKKWIDKVGLLIGRNQIIER